MSRLDAEQLYKACDTAVFSFDNTKELETFEQVVGQDRAVQAIEFSVGVQHDGYNLFVMGPTECGKHTIVRDFINRQASEQTTPDDWVYLNRFDETNKPSAVSLPAGKAVEFRDDMHELVHELSTAVPAAFDSDEYRARRHELDETFKERQSSAFDEVQKEADAHSITLLRTPTGFVFAPIKDGKVLSSEEYEGLPDKERNQLDEVMSVLQERLEQVLNQFPRWRREINQKIKTLNEEVVKSAVGLLIQELKTKYESIPRLMEYLDGVQKEVIEHADLFRTSEEPQLIPGPSMQDETDDFLARFQVNVFVDNSASEGAPVIEETSPTYINLIGSVEHLAHMGALITDFTLIKPGALHRANGGYLILDIRDILTQPYAWEGLKHALRNKEIRIESLGHALSLISTMSLEPEPIPLQVRIILIGDRRLYYLLMQYDPEFSKLFKVLADFQDDMPRTDENCQYYAQLLGTLAEKDELRALEKSAVSRVIEHSARMADDAEKLSARFGKVADLLREANYWADNENSEMIQAGHIQKAIDQARYRNQRIQEQVLEEMLKGTWLIDTSDQSVGQVNGLSVYRVGEYSFGHPVRITARVRPGRAQLIDIEREVKLGGPVHSKGVLILGGFLSGRYASDHPLTLSASLVFEQSYGGVDGDSASSAELYALLSAITGAPIKQSFAVTGSINQQGEVQAIGGVNEKIEGYFDLCEMKGLTGEQGVLIPASNVRHLMLASRVVDAVREGKFAIHAVSHIDQGISLLTGLSAGERDSEGKFPEGSINAMVESRLAEMAQQLRDFSHEKQSEDDS